MQFIYDPECETCGKIRKWLDQRGIEYEARSIRENRPEAAELLEWCDRFKLPLRSFWNSEKPTFRMIRVMNNAILMNRETRAFVIASDISFIRHPIFIGDNFAVIGHSKPEWEAKFGK